MKSSRLVIDIAAAGLLIAILHRHAILNAWYWTYPMLDVIMHFLGGVLVGLITFWVIKTFYKKKLSEEDTVIWILIGVLVVSVGWEVFEYMTGVFLSEEFFPDTLYDLIMDTVGGAAVYFYIRNE